MLGLVDPTIALAFNLEVAMALDEERTRQRNEAEERQLEILAAATHVALERQLITSVTGSE